MVSAKSRLNLEDLLSFFLYLPCSGFTAQLIAKATINFELFVSRIEFFRLLLTLFPNVAVYYILLNLNSTAGSNCDHKFNNPKI